MLLGSIRRIFDSLSGTPSPPPYGDKAYEDKVRQSVRALAKIIGLSDYPEGLTRLEKFALRPHAWRENTYRIADPLHAFSEKLEAAGVIDNQIKEIFLRFGITCPEKQTIFRQNIFSIERDNFIASATNFIKTLKRLNKDTQKTLVQAACEKNFNDAPAASSSAPAMRAAQPEPSQ